MGRGELLKHKKKLEEGDAHNGRTAMAGFEQSTRTWKKYSKTASQLSIKQHDWRCLRRNSQMRG